jgi:hypothetical protein
MFFYYQFYAVIHRIVKTLSSTYLSLVFNNSLSFLYLVSLVLCGGVEVELSREQPPLNLR